MVEVEPVCSYQAPDSWRKKDSVFNLGGLPPTFLKNCKGFRPDRDAQRSYRIPELWRHQETMSIRLPHSIDRLSSLSSLGDSTPERTSPSHHRQPSDASETTGLVQRCVIIQKDQHGFGFTVSGDRVVLVQSVRPGGAAMKAGVKEGDRIIKVNGTMVTNSSHLEVVKLIKSGAYVALTLLGSSPSSIGVSGLQQNPSLAGIPRVNPMIPPPPPPPPLPPPQHITGPKPLQDPEVQKHATQILRNMLRQEEKELQDILPLYGDTSQRTSEGRLSLDSQEADSGLDSGTERFPSVSESLMNRNSVLSDPGLDSPQTSPVVLARVAQHHRRQSSDAPALPPDDQGVDQSPKPLIIGPEEDYDPGYFNNESDIIFQDLEKLKSHPAHLAVFLRYIFSQADPGPLLFYLCSEVYQQTNSKDFQRSLGKDIWSIFLAKTAPLRVKIPEMLQAEIDLRLRNGEEPRSVLCEAQEAVMLEIQEQINDYRSKRTLGLGSLYGENDLLDLDGDPLREHQMAEKQLAALGDILSKYEDDRSVPMDFALNTYMGHAGIRLPEWRPISTAEKAQSAPDKDKWLPFFPKTKKSSNAKKEKDALEDKKRNPILRYIGKPKSSSQSTFHIPLSSVEVKPGSVRNIIQHFENSHQYDAPEPGTQRLSTGSFPEDLLESDSSRSEIRLGRSESLKGREEMKRSRKAENVPRSRSDVDMDAAAEATRLHQSASSSASSLSTRSLENPTPPFTPKMGRRSIESPNLGFCTDVLPHLLEDDLGQLSDLEPEPDVQNWQHTVGKDVVAGLTQREIDRQEVINELFVTEASHLRTLRVLDLIFYQRMKKENLMPRDELARLFPNLPELIEIHNSWCEAMKKLREEGPIIRDISDLMLARFDGPAREELQQVAAQFCSYQSIALELIKTKQRKESRFQLFMQEAESHPQCRRLQLRDLIISEMQRLTKYPLLLESIIKHTEGGTSEHEKLCRARDQCREILKFVNEAVKQTENRHRLESYQKRLDATALERASNPLAAEFKSLDLTTRKMIHEGPLTWRISKDKTLDLQVLLLEDLLVLLQRQEERLLLKCHSKTAVGSSDSKQTFSPVLKLNAVLVRSVATDKRAFFIICTSELGPPQIYELVALTSSDKNIWMELLEEAVQNATKHPGAAPTALHPSPPGSQEPVYQGSPTSRVEINDSEVYHTEPEPKELSGGPGPPQRLQEEPELVAQEEPEQEEDAEELRALPHPSPSLDGENRGIRTRDPVLLALAGPLLMEGLADAALEDVENLRHLILWSLLPGHTVKTQAAGEPEDDLTPTPSVTSITSHPWDPGSPGQALTIGDNTQLLRPEEEEEDVALWSLAHLPPRTRNSGIWDSPELARNPAEEASSTGPAGNYKVVRKGNCFYVSMPAGPLDSSTEPTGTPLSPSQPQHQRRAVGDQMGSSSSPHSLVPRDVGVIFHTIEQLTIKLHRLKDMELAHRELLKSLGGESSGGTTPVGSFHTETARWTDHCLSPPAKEALASDSQTSQEQGSCPEDGSDSATDTAASPGP